MQDHLHSHPFYPSVPQRHLRALLGELPDADDRAHAQESDDVTERALADLVGGVPLGGAQVWRREVLAGFTEEHERAEVVHETASEEDVGSAAQPPEETPEPVAAYLQSVSNKTMITCVRFYFQVLVVKYDCSHECIEMWCNVTLQKLRNKIVKLSITKHTCKIV